MLILGQDDEFKMSNIYFIYYQCAKQLGINYSPIQLCSEGVVGNQLEHMHGVERGPTSDAFLGGGKNERCGNFKVSILSLINFSF